MKDSVTDEETSIRNVVSEWLAASADGDIDPILALMDEEVVFLLPGMEPMRGKQAFADGFRSFSQHAKMEALSEIQEIQISGDLAYCWNHLSVKIIPRDGSSTKSRKGHVLSILRKASDGRWRITRDANLLSSVVVEDSP